MATINEMFPSKYLKHTDLQGKTVKLTIASVQQEKMPDGKMVWVMSFQGTEKALTLNVTKANIICEAFGEDTTSWVGHIIELVAGTTPFQGKMVGCINVRATSAATPAAEPDPLVMPGEGAPLAEEEAGSAEPLDGLDPTGEQIPF